VRILLLYPDIQTIQFYHFQHGLASISAVLKERGHKVDLLYLQRELNEEELTAEVKKYSPDLVGISATTLQHQFAKAFAKTIKDRLRTPVVLGGIHATIAPEEVLKEGLFDFIVRGEGEYPLLELVEALEKGRDWRGIQNLGWMENGGVRLNPVRPPVDLDELPFPDRELFDEDRLLFENDGQVSIMSGRGCPFACTYCCNSALGRLSGGAGKWVRRVSVGRILQEVEYLHKRRPKLKSLIFFDELFTTDRKWIESFCDGYRAGRRTPFRIFARPDTVDLAMLQRMRDAGLYSVIVGVESGDERLRREVMNRKMSNEEVVRVFQWCDELGIEAWCFFMIGVPQETEASIRKSIELARVLKPSHLQLAIFQPFPGTVLHDYCARNSLLLDRPASTIFLNQCRVKMENLTPEQFDRLYQEFKGVAIELEAKKSAAGYFDLASEYGQAQVQAGGDKFVELWLVRIAGVDRVAILIHPPSRVSWKLKLKPGSKLKFGAGFSPDVWDKPGEGCWYLVKVKTRFGKEETVFSKYLDPKHNVNERKWNDFEVDLSKFKDKKIEITLETKVDGNNEYCVAFWSGPHLVSEGSENGAA
jgi:anaerobic magnesium-protoporphyrin IX monomethyl ester cyclase